MHSVIGQGKVEAIVLSKPRERRMLIEEAAGLGKHRKRRRRAQLKLERTRSNLDRALDVEREARSRLRPLRQQANAAETHARLERQSLELQLRLLGDRLAAGGGDLATAEAAARAAREARDGIEAKLGRGERAPQQASSSGLPSGTASARPCGGSLTALRAAHERLGARTESIAGREAELRAAVERRRAALGTLATELRATERDAEVALAQRARIRPRRPRRGEHRRSPPRSRPATSSRGSTPSPGSATGRSAPPDRPDVPRTCSATGARTRSSSGSSPRPSWPRRSPVSAPRWPVPATPSALARPRSRSGSSARRRATSSALELRDCSRVEAELHGELGLIAERVTEAEVRAAQPARPPRGGGGRVEADPRQAGARSGSRSRRHWRMPSGRASRRRSSA